jgi:hypothetical protein
MQLPVSPRSRTLAALSVARGTYMDSITVRKWHVTLMVFMLSWFVLFSAFISFYPAGLMSDGDFLNAFGVAASDGDGIKDNSDNVLSDSGRGLVWGTSLGFAALISFVYHFFYFRFSE